MLRHFRVGIVLALSLVLAACPSPRRTQVPPPSAEPTIKPVPGAAAYDVVPAHSLVRIMVYRAGALAPAGHNHVIASRELTGKVYVHPDLSRSAFELILPVQTLTVDEPDLRRAEGADFPPEVPDSAKQGTRKNMLSQAVLDAERYPSIKLVSTAVSVSGEQLSARVRVGIKGQWREVRVPVRLQRQSQRLQAAGELKLTHTDLGLQPFTALLGALKVQDEMTVKFAIAATRASQAMAVPPFRSAAPARRTPWLALP